MAFDRNRSNDIDNGVVLNGGSGVFYGDELPAVTADYFEGDLFTIPSGKRYKLKDGLWSRDVNFSFKDVDEDDIVEVRPNEQNIMTGQFTMLGQFRMLGEFYQIDLEDSDNQQIIPPADPENFSHFKIASGDTKVIPSNQQMTVYEQITNFGQLNNLGDVRLLMVYQQDDPDDVIVLPDDNFSYKQINASEIKTVPTRQQMVVVGMFKNLGQINVLGEFALISGAEPDYDDDYLPPYKIDSGELFTIKNNRLMFLPRSLINNGQLNNFGELALGGL